MRVIVSILLFQIFGSALWAQEYAVFSADTSRFARFYREAEGLPERYANQRWIINGQEMRYGPDILKVEVNPDKLDTIIFYGPTANRPDTIICNIAHAGDFRFYHNDCCGAFNLRDQATGKFIQGSVLYRLSNSDKKTYLGTMGEAGILMSHMTADTLNVGCRSAMSPNVYPISISEIEVCKDSANCTEGICLQQNDTLNWEFGFRTIAKKMDILFMPLKSEPYSIYFNPQSDTIEIR